MSIRQPTYNFKLTVDNYYEYDIEEPKGFTELESLIYRDLKVHGCFYEMTPAEFPLAFDGIAKQILRDAFDEDGVDSETNVGFLIEKSIYDGTGIGYGSTETYEIAPSAPTSVFFFNNDDQGYGQTITLDESIKLESFYFWFEANTGAPTATVNAYLASTSAGVPDVVLATITNISPVASSWNELVFDYDLSAGQYAIYMISNNDGTLDVGNYYNTLHEFDYGSGYQGGTRITKAAGVSVWNTYISDYKCKYDYQVISGDVEEEFRGNIDFSAAKEDDEYFYCSVLRSDLLVDVLNNRDKEVKLNDTVDIRGEPVMSNTLKDVYMHSFKIRKKWAVVKRAESTPLTEGSQQDAFVLFGWDETLSEEIDESQDWTYQFQNVLNGDNTDANWIADVYEGDLHVTLVWDVNLTHSITNTSGAPDTFEHQIYLKVVIYNSAHGEKETLTFLTIEESTGVIADSATDINPDDVNYTGTDTQTYEGLVSGDYIKIFFEYNTGNYVAGCDTSFEFLPTNVRLDFDIDTVEPFSTADGYLVYDALEDCLRKITGLSYPLNSDFFNTLGCGYLNILTNGWQIRKFTNEPVTVSFSDLFMGLSAIFGLGYGVEQEEKVKVELWEYFYQDRELIDLEDVGDYEENVIGDEIFNHVKLGFRYYANDEDISNTKEDFHNEAAWNTPIVSHKGEFERISSIICSSFLIEAVRRTQYLDKPTTSTRWDDHKFLIAVDVNYETITDYIAESNESMTVTGLTNGDSAYNLRHTIKRMLLNWGVWINSFSMRYKSATATLRNLYFRNNGTVTTQFNADEDCLMGATDNLAIREDDDITKEEIQGGYTSFDQKTIHFTKQLTDEQLDKIKDAHDGSGDNYNTYNYGYISCNDYKGRKVNGWLLECQYNIYSKLARFKLLKRYVGGLVEFTIAWDCLPNNSTFDVDAVQPQVSQWISLPAGELRKIYINKVDSGEETVLIYITKVIFQGYPDVNNKLYNQGHSIAEGDNEIDIDLTITESDCYAIGIRYSAPNSVELQGVSQYGIEIPCYTEYIMPSQTSPGYGNADWDLPTSDYNLRHRVDYLPLNADIKTLMITSSSAGFGYRIDYSGKVMCQQIEFLSDVEVHNVVFYVLSSGVPTATMQCYLYAYDNTKAGNLGAIQGIGSASGASANEVLSTFPEKISLSAGKYVFMLKANNDGVLDVSNYYLPHYTLHFDAYKAGLYMQWFNLVWTELTANRMKMKIRYELS